MIVFGQWGGRWGRFDSFPSRWIHFLLKSLKQHPPIYLTALLRPVSSPQQELSKFLLMVKNKGKTLSSALSVGRLMWCWLIRWPSWWNHGIPSGEIKHSEIRRERLIWNDASFNYPFKDCVFKYSHIPRPWRLGLQCFEGTKFNPESRLFEFYLFAQSYSGGWVVASPSGPNAGHLSVALWLDRPHRFGCSLRLPPCCASYMGVKVFVSWAMFARPAYESKPVINISVNLRIVF